MFEIGYLFGLRRMRPYICFHEVYSRYVKGLRDSMNAHLPSIVLRQGTMH